MRCPQESSGSLEHRTPVAPTFAYEFPAIEMSNTHTITGKQRDGLLTTLRSRFEANGQRHVGVEWSAVQERLDGNNTTLWTLNELERSGGEPDVVDIDTVTGGCVFMDCSAQSPKGRRSLCYDRAALDARREHKPKSSAVEMATAMGATLLTVAEYRRLQGFGEFDTSTSSWVQTPPDIRTLGGALFCDRRYNTVFVYHNGAESYYAARGFRCSVRV